MSDCVCIFCGQQFDIDWYVTTTRVCLECEEVETLGKGEPDTSIDCWIEEEWLCDENDSIVVVS